MIFKQQAEDDFDVKSVVSPEMEVILRRCANIYAGAPPWLSADDDIRTINFAKAVSSETARLATLAIDPDRGIDKGGVATETDRCCVLPSA